MAMNQTMAIFAPGRPATAAPGGPAFDPRDGAMPQPITSCPPVPEEEGVGVESQWGGCSGRWIGVVVGVSLLVILSTATGADTEAPPQAPPLPDLSGQRIVLERPLPQRSELRYALYRLELTHPADPAPDRAAERAGLERFASIPRAGVQRPVFADERTILLVVDAGRPVNPAADMPRQRHRKPGPRVPAEDEALARSAAEALADQPDATTSSERAIVLSQTVARWWADESEEGHPALAAITPWPRPLGESAPAAWSLAAALRSQGIPARVVAGLVYAYEPAEADKNEQEHEQEQADAEPAFTFRMWVQAWVGGDEQPREGQPPPIGARWVDLDATDPADHTGRIALASGVLENQDLHPDAAALADLLDRLRIEVISPRPFPGDR